MKTNGTVAKRFAKTVPKAASWKAFDALPRALREMLWAAPLPINPLDVQSLIDLAGADYAAGSISDAINVEMAAFAAEYRMRYQMPLPHHAARATRQEYQPDAQQPRRIRARTPRLRPHHANCNGALLAP